MALLSELQMQTLGFAELGRNVRISDRASFYNPAAIRIGDNVRIDDFCLLSAGVGGITLGSHIHIAAYSSLMGAGSIRLQDFCNISSRVAIYSSSDDYSGQAMTSPVIPKQFTKVTDAPVSLGRHVIVGTGSVILPGAELLDGVAVGALSLVKGRCPPFGIYAGVPARRLKERVRDLLELELAYLSTQGAAR